MMNPIRAALAAAVLLFAANAARADVYCDGAVYEYLVYSDGNLMIRSYWRQDWTVLCNMQGSWNNVSTETCFSWLAVVNAAKTNNKALGIYYSGNTACNALPTYSNAPTPVYVRIEQ